MFQKVTPKGESLNIRFGIILASQYLVYKQAFYI